MRTLEQTHQFILDRLNVAIAATARAERKIDEAQKKKSSALAYADANVEHAQRELIVAQRKAGFARDSVPLAEQKAHSLRAPALNLAIARLQRAENAAHDALLKVESARACVAALKDAADILTPGLVYARNLVEVTARSAAAALVKLNGVMAARETAGSRYDPVIEAATAVRDDFKRREAIIQDQFINAGYDIENRDRKEIAAKLKANREEVAEEKVFQKHKAEQLARTVTQTDNNNATE